MTDAPEYARLFRRLPRRIRRHCRNCGLLALGTEESLAGGCSEQVLTANCFARGVWWQRDPASGDDIVEGDTLAGDFAAMCGFLCEKQPSPGEQQKLLGQDRIDSGEIDAAELTRAGPPGAGGGDHE